MRRCYVWNAASVWSHTHNSCISGSSFWGHCYFGNCGSHVYFVQMMVSVHTNGAFMYRPVFSWGDDKRSRYTNHLLFTTWDKLLLTSTYPKYCKCTPKMKMSLESWKFSPNIWKTNDAYSFLQFHFCSSPIPGSPSAMKVIFTWVFPGNFLKLYHLLYKAIHSCP